MENIGASAKSIAAKLVEMNEDNVATEKELLRRVANERALCLGHIAAKDETSAPKSVINSALRSKLTRLAVLASTISPETGRVEQFLTSMEHTPTADRFQQQRICDLKRELAEKGVIVSINDLTAYLYKRINAP